MMATVFYTDGTFKRLIAKSGGEFTAAELHELVGGYIEHVGLPNGEHLIVNEDGMRLKLPLNKLASDYVRSTGIVLQGDNGYDPFLLGTCIILDKDEIS